MFTHPALSRSSGQSAHSSSGLTCSVQALLVAGQPAKASLSLKVLLESNLDLQKRDLLVLLFLAKAGLQAGTLSALLAAVDHAR